LPIAPSAINADSFAVLIGGRQVPTVTPRALETDEIPGLIAEFVAAAENAVRAGFDGVELHAANGYLLHQFLSEQSNRRQDRYGGTPENRCRFVLEVASAVAQAIGADRVGIRISPVSGYQNALIGDPVPTFGHLLDHLDRLRLGYVHVVEGFAGVSRDDPPFDYRALRQHFSGVWIANNMYDPDLAEQALANGAADLVSFGRPFIANPDLVRRYRDGSTLNAINPDTLFAEGEVGYTDYPALG